MPNGVFSVSNQGTVSGSNFANVLTDDTSKPGSADPTVTVVAAPPTANNQSVNVLHNTGKAITLTGSDPNTPTQTLTFAIVANPTNGSLSGFNASTGAVTYTPNANYAGSDSFTFKVIDDGGGWRVCQRPALSVRHVGVLSVGKARG